WLFGLARKARAQSQEALRVTADQICTLGPKLIERVANNAVLFLCVPSAHLVAGHHLKVVKAWGFRPTMMGFEWVKLRKGADPTHVTLADLHKSTGLTTRKNIEHVVLCKRGKSLRSRPLAQTGRALRAHCAIRGQRRARVPRAVQASVSIRVDSLGRR